MTPAAIAVVVAEIEAYGRGERQGPLSWKALRDFSGFSQVSLWKKLAIKTAFVQVRQAQRIDATPAMRRPRTADERVLALEKTVDRLAQTIRAYDELWVLYEYNVQRVGIEPSELRQPLQTAGRQAVRKPQMRALP
jgi:hypothetical protein